MLKKKRREADAEPGVATTLLELVAALAVYFVVLFGLGQFFLRSSDSFSELVSAAHLKDRAEAILDRVVDELLDARMTSLEPREPVRSPAIRFRKVVDVVDGAAVLGNPVQIELSRGGELRIWEDEPPHDRAPGPEDSPSILEVGGSATKLSFTRRGSLVVIDVVLRNDAEESPVSVELSSAVSLRNKS